MKIKLPFLVIAILLSGPVFTQVCIDQATLSLPLSYNSGNAPSVIAGLRISNSNGSCISLVGCHNITISNCILGGSPISPAIHLEGCTNVTITNCIFKDMAAGVYALTSQGIKVNYNQFVNVQYVIFKGQFVQFDKVYGAGNEVMYNVGENIPGNSRSEDLISMYKSRGTATSPILIKGNRFRGTPFNISGGGILLGDDGGAYMTVEDNILVDVGSHGIGIASGNNITVRNNKIYARQHDSIKSVGLYVWNQYDSVCSNHTVENNIVKWTKWDGTPNSCWDAQNCGTITGFNTNWCDAAISDTILPPGILCPELTAYYKFNNNWADATGNNLTANAVGPYLQSDCDDNLVSARFTGTINQMVTIPQSDALRPSLQRISVSCWIKPATITGIKGIARGQDGNGWDNSWRMILNDDVFNPRITTESGSAEVSYSGIQANVWSHVVMTYDGKQLKAYVNGVLQDAVSLEGDILYYPSIQTNMQLGFANGDYYFNGQLDEFRFYSGDLNAAEVSDLYNLHKDSFECGSLLLTSLYR